MLFKRIVPDLVISNAGLGTELEKDENLSPFLLPLPRNSLVCWDQCNILRDSFPSIVANATFLFFFRKFPYIFIKKVYQNEKVLMLCHFDTPS